MSHKAIKQMIETNNYDGLIHLLESFDGDKMRVFDWITSFLLDNKQISHVT